jgi:hypothetical protein
MGLRFVPITRLGKPDYIDVDELQARTSLEEAATKCGVDIDVIRNGVEVRIDCLFRCPGDHRGKREISVNTENPQKVFCCHSYGCQVRGNLLTLMHGWLTGQRPAGDRLKGDEFNRVKQVLAGHVVPPAPTARGTTPAPAAASNSTERNLPLAESDNEKARELVTLDEKFVTDVAAMQPAAASYVRRHPCLTPDSLRKWRVGSLPQDGGGDKRGWSLRGQIIYPVLSERGQILAWVARDPSFEEKERQFLALSPAERAAEKPPCKHRFPAGFQRGQELFGQQAARLHEPGYRELIAAHGIIVVEGFNDVIGLDNLGIPAVAIMSNRITERQVEKICRWAAQLAGGKVVILFDADSPGDEGAKEALWLFAQRRMNVRLGWTAGMENGRFAGRQPEQMSREDWMSIAQGRNDRAAAEVPRE